MEAWEELSFVRLLVPSPSAFLHIGIPFVTFLREEFCVSILLMNILLKIKLVATNSESQSCCPKQRCSFCLLSALVSRPLADPVCPPLCGSLPEQRAQGDPYGGCPNLLPSAHTLCPPHQWPRSCGQPDCSASGGRCAQQTARGWDNRSW